MCNELCCQLCRVSFWVHRHRRPEEPIGVRQERVRPENDIGELQLGGCAVASENWGKGPMLLPCFDVGNPQSVVTYVRDFKFSRIPDSNAFACQNGGCCVVRHNDWYEHVAGPDCTHPWGYNGWKISTEEMQGARTMQWLVPKPPNWSPEPDDQEFETSSQYFLTGLVEVIDNNFAEMTPIRHGVRSARGKNGYLHSIFEDKGEIPFHPSCFELFKRLSRQVRGFVDVDALVDWRNNTWLPIFHASSSCDIALWHSHLRYANVREEWLHVPQHEYLVANPVEVPGLQALLETCPKICANSVSVSTLIAQYVRRPTIMRGTDPFTKLPKEIQHKVLEDMDPGDVANLRLVSREFLQLPNMFFKELVEREMPWLWEAKGLNVGETDWCALYSRVKFVGLRLKGLRNRARIWRQVQRDMWDGEPPYWHWVGASEEQLGFE